MPRACAGAPYSRGASAPLFRAIGFSWATCPVGAGLARWARRGSRAEVCVQRRPRPPPCLSPRANLENLLAWRALQPSVTIRRAISARLQRNLAGEIELGVLSNTTPFQARLGTFGALDASKRCAMTARTGTRCASGTTPMCTIYLHPGCLGPGHGDHT